jgi:cellulose synthase/poly-beta-1,6-N-acetylglucosamine synthase-like glycosyltransferase
MDADTQIDRDYYKHILAKFKSCPEAAAVCGRPLSLPHNALTAYRASSYFLTNFLYKQGQSNMGVITVAPGCATTYRSDVFEVLDWNKDTLVEDMDVTVQVQRICPGSIVFENKAVVFTQDPRTMKDYTKQMDRWQVGAWQVFKKHEIFTGNKKLDWEMKLIWGEGLLFSFLFSISPLLIMLHRGMVGRILELDFVGLFFVSLCCAVSEKRWDVLYYCPLYELYRFVDALVFLRAFWKVILIKKPTEGWASPKRY